MNFFLVTFFLVFSRTDRQTDRRTDTQTDGQKATPKSPPCMSTGGLNKCNIVYRSVHPQPTTLIHLNGFIWSTTYQINLICWLACQINKTLQLNQPHRTDKIMSDLFNSLFLHYNHSQSLHYTYITPYQLYKINHPLYFHGRMIYTENGR